MYDFYRRATNKKYKKRLIFEEEVTSIQSDKLIFSTQNLFYLHYTSYKQSSTFEINIFHGVIVSVTLQDSRKDRLAALFY